MDKAYLPDEKNPEYLFQTINTDLLLKGASGEIDLIQLAKKEVANRGLDKNGKWIGFERAEKEWKL